MFKTVSLASSFILLLGATPLVAQTLEDSQLDEIRVLGDTSEGLSTPLAPQRVSKERLENFKYTDVNRALKQTSGVYIREEDGQGLRPNIGLRGVNPDRSKKIVLMEDGVLIGPAPYSAPAAYYTPNMNHIESLEVFKGFSAVPYGPSSVGGAVNYIGLGIPGSLQRSVEMSGSSFNTQNYKLGWGESLDKFGYLIQGSMLSTDGFKELDKGGKTGFEHKDLHTAFRWTLPSERPQFLTFRYGYADEDSQETYLGTTEEDFFSSPNRRYASSAWDDMTWRHYKLQLEHLYQPTETSYLRTTLYNHRFHRTWYRLDGFRDSSISVRNVLLDPTGTNEIFYRILSGQSDSSATVAGAGDIKIFNNDRQYVSQGIQSKYGLMLTHEEFQHDIELNLRLHNDRIDRDHTYDFVSMTGGSLVSTGTSGLQDKQDRDEATALSLGLQDNVTVGPWVFTGVARAEVANFEHTDKSSGDSDSREDSVFVPGVGVLYKFTEDFGVRASINKAATLAGLDASKNEVKEESTNYEVGVKIASDDKTRMADITGFYNDYENIMGLCTVSSGCTGGSVDTQYNGGTARVYGIEAMYAQGFLFGKLWVPIQINATFLQAEFTHSFTSSNAEWGVGDVKSGDPLPYVPSMFYTFVVGAEYGAWKQELAFVYQSKMYDQSVSDERREIDAYGVVDWTGQYKFSKGSSFYAKIDNVLGREYAVALRPFGYRPGKPRSIGVGFTYAF